MSNKNNTVDPLLDTQISDNAVITTKTTDPLLDNFHPFKDTPTAIETVGSTGVGESSYDINVPKEQTFNLEELRSQRQGRLTKLGAGLTNAITQTGLDIIKDTSYLLDFENIFDNEKSAQEGYGNWLADAMTSAEEAVKLPVYRTKESEGFSPWSSGWWGDNLPSIASTVAMAVPAQFASLGLSKIGKLVGGGKLIKNIETATGVTGLANKATGVNAAILSRHMESIMEGGQTFQDTFDKSMKIEGMTEDRAKIIAGEAAANNYKANWANLITDIPQYLTINKTFSKTLQDFKFSKADLVKNIIGESAEEAYQYISNEETKRAALIKYGVEKDDKSDLTDRLTKYAQEGDFWTSAFLGGLGGGLFSAGGKMFNSKQEASQREVFDRLTALHTAVIKGDKETFNRESDTAFVDTLVKHVGEDKTANLKEAIKESIGAIEDQQERIDTQKTIRERLQVIDFAENLKTKLESDNTKSPELKAFELDHAVRQKLSATRLQEINQKLSKLQLEDALITSLVDPTLYQLKLAKLELKAIEGLESLTDKTKELKKSIKSSEELLVKEGQFKTVEDINKALTTANDADISQLLYNRAVEQKQLGDIRNNLYKLSTLEGKDEFQAIVDKTKKKAEIKKDLKTKATQVAPETTTSTPTTTTVINPFSGEAGEITETKEPENLYINESLEELLERKTILEGQAKDSERDYHLDLINKAINKKQPVIDVETNVNEDPSIIHTQFSDVNEGFKAVIDFDIERKTELGKDDGTVPSRNRFFRWIENTKLQGHKLLVVTKNNNKDLYNEILDHQKEEKDENNLNPREYEDNYKKKTSNEYDGIYLVVTDAEGNHIKVDGIPLFVTTTRTKADLSDRISTGEILVKDKTTALKQLTEFREKLLALSKNVFLQITSKSKGVPQFLPKIDGKRQSKNVNENLGKVTLFLPTQSNSVLPTSSQSPATLGKLYALFNDKAVDLVPRTVSAVEAEKIFELINIGTKEAIDEIKKLIYFGVGKKGITDYTFTLQEGKLFIGTETLTPDVYNTPEGKALIIQFLTTKKNVNVNSKYSFKDSFTDINGKTWDSYQEYLLDGENPLFGTDLKPKGEIQYRNIYLKYSTSFTEDSIKPKSTIKTDEDKDAKTADILKKAKEASITKEPAKRGRRNKGLNRLATEDRKKQTKLTEEEINWFKTVLPNVPVTVIQGLIEDEALGRFISSGKVLLSDNATKGTLYHEAFHAVTQLYLTPKELAAIYREAKEVTGLKTDLEVEEILAEDFIEYKKTGKILKNRPHRNTLFRKIVDFLRDLLNLKASTIEEVYRRLDKGYYSNKQIVGIRQFAALDKALPDKTEKFTKELLDGLDAEFFKIAFRNNLTPEQALNRQEDVFNKIFDIIADIEETTENPNTKADIAYVLDNWDSLIIPVWTKRLNSIGIEIEVSKDEETTSKETVKNEEIKSVDEGEEKALTEVIRQGDAFTASNTISTKSTMFDSTKMLIRGLLKVKELDKEGNLVYEKSNLGLDQTVDFNKTYNFLLKNLAGLSEYPEIYNKIKELSKIKPELLDLLKRLGEPTDNIDFEHKLMQLQFRQDFAKNRQNSAITIIEADGKIYLLDANRQETSDKVKEQWRANSKIKNTINSEGQIVIDPKILDIKDNITFLSKIGIVFSKETIEYIDDIVITEAVTSIKNSIKNKENVINDLFGNQNSFDSAGRIKELIDLEATYTPNVNELSFLSAEGKTIYSISLNNGLSIINNIINNSKTKEELFQRLPHLNTLLTEGSVYLDRLFDSKGNKREGITLDLGLHDGVNLKNAKGNKIDSDATAKLTIGDKYVQEINSILLYGKSSIIRTADKATENTLGINSWGKNQKLVIPIESVEKGFNNKKIDEIFTNYFLNEVKRIAYFEVKGLGKNIDQYSQMGNKWTIFSNMTFNSKESKKNTKKEVESEIKALSKDLSDEQLEVAIKQIVDTHIKDVLEGIKIYFGDYSRELENELNNYKITNGSGISTELSKYTTDQLCRAVSINDFINSVEQLKLFFGDMAFYKNQLFKRTSAFAGTKETTAVDVHTNNWLNNNNKRLDKKIADGKINVVVFEDSKQNSSYIEEYTKALIDSGISEEEAKSLLDKYLKMDEGDAQGWITLDEYREFAIRRGAWDNTMENAWDKIQANQTLTTKELSYFLTLKAQYAGPQVYSGLYVPTFHKFSLMPLIPQLVKGKNLENLLNSMTKQEVGYALFKSGSKVGTLINDNGKANKFYTEDTHGEINTENWQKQEVFYQFLGLQTKTSKPKEKVIFGTQFRKLLFSNLFEEGNQQSEDAKELFTEYNNAIISLIKEEEEKLVKEFGLTENPTKESLKKLVDALRSEAEDRNLPDNIIEALQNDKITGELMYKFDAQVNKAKIDSMLMSLINSRLIRQKMNGDALVQGASSGFEQLGVRKAGSNSSLKFYTKDKPWAECMVPMSKNYRPLLEKYKTIENLNKAITNNEVDTKILTLIGYRIPTQGLNSIEHFRIKEFLPEESATIILPTEIVAKSGGDFDIDKMNIFRPDLDKADYDNTSKNNKIIEIASKILAKPENFTNLIIPNSTHILTDIVDYMRWQEYVNKKKSKGEKYEEDYKLYTENRKKTDNTKYTDQLKLTYKIDQFSKFMLAKDMIGIAAIANTSHTIAQIVGQTLNKQYISDYDRKTGYIYTTVNINFKHNETKDDKLSISKIKDAENNHNISEVISQIINAVVDAAKDPFFKDLNMTKETLPTYLYLIKLGVPFEDIAYFMKQPIISKYLEELTINKSNFLKDKESTIKLNERFRTELYNKVSSKFKDESGLKEAFILDKNILKPFLETDNQNSEEYHNTQFQVFLDFLEYTKQSSLLSDAIKSINHDTAGVGENLTSSHIKIKDIKEVKNTQFVNNIQDILDNTFIGAMNKHQESIDWYSPHYYTQAKEIVDNTKMLISDIAGPFSSDDKKITLGKLIENDFISFIIQNYGYENIADIKEKVFKTDSIAKKLAIINNNPKTPHEVTIKNNLLVQELTSIINNPKNNGLDNLKTFSKRYDTFTANQLTESFRELKELDKELAQQIMDAGILQSGLNNSPITYLGLIPYEYYNDIVKKGFEKFNSIKDKQLIIEQFNKLFQKENKFYKGSAYGANIWGKNYELKPLAQEYKQSEKAEYERKLKLWELNSNGKLKFFSEGDASNSYNNLLKSFDKSEVRRPYKVPNQDIWTITIIKPTLETGRFEVDKDIRKKFFDKSNKTTATLALRKIAESTHPLNKLAKHLIKYALLNNVEIHLDAIFKYTKEEHNLSIEEASAIYNTSKNEIRLAEFGTHRGRGSEVTIIHEILHALTNKEVHKNGEINQEFQRIYDEAVKVLGKDSSYALHDIDEFIVGVFTDGEFISKLMKIPSIDNIKSKNLFQQLFDYILSLFKITSSNNLYEQAFAVATNIVEKQAENTAPADLFSEEDPSVPNIILGAKSSSSIDAIEAPFKEQRDFFEREMRKLERELKTKIEGTDDYNTTKDKLTTLRNKVEQATAEKSQSLFKELGDEALNKAESIIKDMETGKSYDTAGNIMFIKDIIDTFIEFRHLEGRAKDLRDRLYPYWEKHNLQLVQEHSTEEIKPTQEDIDKTTKDISTIKGFWGSLIDSPNLIARTIGLIIKTAQNRIAVKDKKEAAEIQVEIDALEDYAKKNGVEPYSVFIQETDKGSTTVLTQEYFSDGKENPNYIKIQETPELKRFYDFYLKKLEEANEKLPFSKGKFYIPDIKNRSLKEKIKGLNPIKERTGNYVKDKNSALDVVPFQFNKKLAPSEKSTELGQNLLAFVKYSNNFEEMSSILPKVRLLQESIKFKKESDGHIVSRKFLEASNPKNAIDGKQTNLFKHTQEWIKMQVKGEMKLDQGKPAIADIYDAEGNKIGEKYVSIAETIDNFLKWNSLLRIGLSPVTALTNVIFGDVSNIMEAIGGRYFGFKELHYASSIFGKQSLTKDSDMNKLLLETNPFQELDDYQQLEEAKIEGKYKRLSQEKLEEYVYFMQKSGEKWLQGRTMIALAIKNGYMTKEGKITPKWTNETEAKKAQFVDLTQRLNQKIHGRYTAKEAAVGQQNVLYRMFFQFRKWIPATVEARFGEAQYDVRLQTDIEGIYRTFGRLVGKNLGKGVYNLYAKIRGKEGYEEGFSDAFSNLFLPLLNAKKAIEKGNLTETEIYNMRRMMAELITITGMAFLVAGLKGGDDDKDRKRLWYVKIGLTLLNRVSGDLEFVYNPTNVSKLLSNAAPVSRLLTDLANTMKYIPYAFYIGDSQYKRGGLKGSNKFYSNIPKVLPLGSPALNLYRLGNKEILPELE